ncbi:MAG: sulfotransferase domain-containing protein [Planctomycetota bacterium]
MRFPDFLYVGAMKAGTTTLKHDLAQNPHVYLPAAEEPTDLIHPEALSDAGRSAYASHYRFAEPQQLCGDGSTCYSKMPEFQGVPNRARQLLGDDIKVLYSVREPVSRIVSHHYHFYALDRAPASIDEAVRNDPQFINHTRYAWQIEPWIDTFGRDRIHIEHFEEYTSDRRAGIERVCAFLGVPSEVGEIDGDKRYNASTNHRRVVWPLNRVAPTIKRVVNDSRLGTVLPRGWVEGVKRTISQPPKARPAPPSPDTVDFILASLRDDIDRLGQIMARDAPLWDAEAVRRRYAEARDKSETGSAA